jgi:hypothetical protein
VTIFIGVLSTIVAACVAFIAWLQWRTAEEKVRLDLFDRRFAVYDELRAAVWSWRPRGGIAPAAVDKFKMASSPRR